MRKKKTRMGRPPKAPADKYSAHILVNMRQAERAMLEAEAKRRKMSLSALLMHPWREKKAKGTRQDCAGKAQGHQLD